MESVGSVINDSQTQTKNRAHGKHSTHGEGTECSITDFGVIPSMCIDNKVISFRSVCGDGATKVIRVFGIEYIQVNFTAPVIRSRHDIVSVPCYLRGVRGIREKQ